MNTDREPLFAVGDRIAFKGLFGFHFGAIWKADEDGYRIEWDDEYDDGPAYSADELLAESDIREDERHG